MTNIGKKITALLLTAVCLIGVLPLSVLGASETIYVPAIAALTQGYRPSASNHGLMATRDYNSITIPLPLNYGQTVNITVPNSGDFYPAVLILDDSYNYLRVLNIAASGTIEINANNLIQAGFVQIGYSSQSDIGDSIIINNVETTVLVGGQTIAKRERYEIIEVPDPPSPPTDGIKIQPLLDMWEQLLVQIGSNLTEFYSQLVEDRKSVV